MKTIFSIRRELEAEVKKLNTDLEASVKLADDAQAEIAILNDKIKELESKATGVAQADHQKVIDENKTLVEQVATLNKLVAETNEKMKQFEQQVADKAVQVIADCGTPLVPITPQENPASLSTMDARYSRFVITNK